MAHLHRILRHVRRPVVILVAGRRRLAMLVAAVLLWALGGGSVVTVSRLHSASGMQALAGRVIAVDPGHGGVDSGATHPESPLAEKEITLDVARRLGRLIRRAGGTAVLTRTDDWESDLPDRAELKRRADVAVAGRAEVFLSLHVDSFSDASCQYAQVFYHPSSAEGKRLALAIEAELLEHEPDNYRRAAPADFFLLKCTAIPSALVELGFLSHPDERHRLNQPAYREALARLLLRAAVRYFSTPGGDGGQAQVTRVWSHSGPRMAKTCPTRGPGTGELK